MTWHWWGAAVACVALVAASAAVGIDAQRTLNEVPGLQQGVELLDLERDAGAAVGRVGFAALRAAYDDPRFRDLPEARAGAAAELRDVQQRLNEIEPMPGWASTIERLQSTLDGGIRRMEAPDAPPEGLWAWQWSFTTAFSGIFPADLTGRWSPLLEFTLGTQYGVYQPVSLAELTLGRWALDGVAVSRNEALAAYLESEAAVLESLSEEHDGTSPLDPEFDPGRAGELDTRWGRRIEVLRAAPEMAELERGFYWMVGVSDDDPWVGSPEALFEHTEASLALMESVGATVLRESAGKLDEIASGARLRLRVALVVGIVVGMLGLGVLGWWMRARNRLEAHLRVAAEYDALTGVESRFALYFHEESRLARSSSRGAALLLTDMDDFKSINDRWGHAVGDAALVKFAEACRAVIGPKDRVARIGGDEFVIMLHDRTAPAKEAAAVAERLHALLAAPIVVGEVSVHLRATVGIAVAEGPAHLDELLLQADTALLDAKKNRRSRHAIFNRNHRRNLIREIDGALADGHIEAVFQPIVRSDTHELSGAELLARWTREDGSQVPLANLIEAMVSMGASGIWTERMLLAAARVIPFLPNKNVRFWLNVAMPDLVGPGARVLIDTVSAGPVPAQRLGIEITERIPPSDLIEARSTLMSLRATGVEIALDDVGSDTVPLRHMTDLPLDRVKIDGSLVRDADTSMQNRALLRAIVNGAADLELEIVAEEVETDGEAAVLKYLGVQHLQGYRTGAPVTLDTFISAARRDRSPEPAESSTH
ncbi:MAG: EAL domain-containing protein [Gemmatimonadetes bacterium]|nr:EAL domain-containing protein [Gemmatimonadota bacterium]